MKKVIIAILLVICVCVPVFADMHAYAYPAVGVSTGIAFGKDGVSFDGVGVFAEVCVGFNSPIMIDAKAEFKYSFSDASRTGAYIDLCGNYGLLGKAGVGIDLHKVGGEIAYNMSALIGGSFPINGGVIGDSTHWYALPSLTFRYTFLNNTGIPAFAIDLGAGALFMRYE